MAWKYMVCGKAANDTDLEFNWNRAMDGRKSIVKLTWNTSTRPRSAAACWPGDIPLGRGRASRNSSGTSGRTTVGMICGFAPRIRRIEKQGMSIFYAD